MSGTPFPFMLNFGIAHVQLQMQQVFYLKVLYIMTPLLGLKFQKGHRGLSKGLDILVVIEHGKHHSISI
jgi:hypothetical protein